MLINALGVRLNLPLSTKTSLFYCKIRENFLLPYFLTVLNAHTQGSLTMASLMSKSFVL